ncbi:MAG: purine-cytosine permease family protein [Gammaproteobacteria bacterium]
MSDSSSSRIEDHALEPVPAGERKAWLDISWSTIGIGTTLIQLYIGAMICFVAGIKIGVAAGVAVAIAGSLLGWGAGHMAYKTGLTSTLMARQFGFGIKGSLITSAIFGFMLIGFIAVENVLLYKGLLFYLNAEDTVTNRIIVYGALSAAWIVLTTWGFSLVTKVSSLMLISFIAVLAYILVSIFTRSQITNGEALSFASQFSTETLSGMGITSAWDKFVFCVNILAGSAGALALIDADLGRYSKSSKDIGIAAALGNLSLDVVMVIAGAVILFAGMPMLIDYYINIEGMVAAQAERVAIENPDRIAAAFVIFSGALGAILMFVAQSKAQVLNTYSSSLSMANLMDALLGWRPGRFFFVIAVNALSMLFLYGEIIAWFNAFLVVLGILTTCFAAIMIADYFIVAAINPQLSGHHQTHEQCNWAGIISICIGFVLAHYLLIQINPIEFLTAVAISLLVYPLLRTTVLRPRT